MLLFKNQKRIQILLKILGLVTFFVTLSNYIFDDLKHMSTSNILPGIAPHLKLGVPYLDFWDIYPPGIYIFYYLYYFIGHDALISYSILHTIVLSLTCFFSYKIFKILDAPIIVYYISLIYFLSPLYINYILPNDLIALFFSFFGLYSFLYFNKTFPKLIFSNFLFCISFLIKETVIFASLTILIYSLYKKNKTFFTNSIIGFGFPLILIYTLSIFQKNTDFIVQSYLQKFQIVKNLNIQILFFSTTVLIISYVVLKNRIKKLDIQLNENQTVVIFHSILILIFFLLGLRDDGSHFDIPKIFSLFFLLTILFKVKIKNFYVIIIVIAVTGSVLKANHSIYSYLLIDLNQETEYANASISEKFSESTVELIKNSNKDILYAYGWSSPNFFYELKLTPFSKYWIIHPGILLESEIKMLKDEIYKTQPKFIYYCGYINKCFGEVDFDYLYFEANYINFKNLIDNCYKNVENQIYIIKDNICMFDFDF